MFRKSIGTGILVAGIASVAVPATAATWTGGTDTTWNTNANWTSPATVPNSSATALFDGAPTANQPDLNGGSRDPLNVQFNTAGWTVTTGAAYTLKPWGNIISSGAGTNTINGNLGVSGSSSTVHTFQIDAGNTLLVTGNAGSGGKTTYTGTGTLVVEGTNSIFPANMPFNLFVNSATAQTLPGEFKMAPGTIFGGLSNLVMNNYAVISFGEGAAYSPGYDPTTPIATTTLAAVSGSVGFNLTGAKLIMDIGTTLGLNDQVIAGTGIGRSGGLTITNSELALRGTTIEDGDYTLLVETGGSITGVFSSITFNGLPADPANFNLTYNTGNSSIVLSVTGMNIPEPATLAMVGVGGLLMIRRRKVA